MGWEKDLPPGERIVACFRPFLEHLVRSNLSRKTIRKHIDNLLVLGGEIIRDVNEDPPLRKIPVERLLLDVIDDDGGPLIHNCDSEDQQRSFDSTCRNFAASSVNSTLEAARYPQIPPTSHKRECLSSCERGTV